MDFGPVSVIGQKIRVFSHRAIEYCLAHSVKDKTEAAYQRDDLLEKRREIMKSWAEFIISEKK